MRYSTILEWPVGFINHGVGHMVDYMLIVIVINIVYGIMDKQSWIAIVVTVMYSVEFIEELII